MVTRRVRAEFRQNRPVLAYASGYMHNVAIKAAVNNGFGERVWPMDYPTPFATRGDSGHCIRRARQNHV